MPKWRNWNRKTQAPVKTISKPVVSTDNPRAGNCVHRRLMVGDIVRPNRFMSGYEAMDRDYAVVDVYARTVLCRDMDGEYCDYRFDLVRAADE